MPKLKFLSTLLHFAQSLLKEQISVFLMYESCGILSQETETVRKLCKHTIFVPDCNSHPYNNMPENEAADLILKNCRKRLLDAIGDGRQCTRLPGEWSHFLSLTYPKVDSALDVMSELTKGVDAIELRVDLLEDISPFSLHRQIALLKDFARLPIIFTVRTVGQIGKFPDCCQQRGSEPETETETETACGSNKCSVQELLMDGLRAGVDWIDVEAGLPAHIIKNVVDTVKQEYGSKTKIIGSLHVTTPQCAEALDLMFKQCELGGGADVVKVVTGADSNVDCELLQARGKLQTKPWIGVCLGANGELSRVLNRYFTPVTHELMKAAAPGQLTVKSLMARRVSLNLIVPKQFYLFGNPIQHSLSPSMHNNAFASLLMPHKYSLFESPDVSVYADLMHESSFGGASVTIPHKETIIPYLDEVRGAAAVIGAVNTIVVEEEILKPVNGDLKSLYKKECANQTIRKLVGYNTDWIGIRRPIARLLQSSNNAAGDVGLVVGAGKQQFFFFLVFSPCYRVE